MKNIIIVGIMIILLIVSGIMSYNMLSTQAESMKDMINELEYNIINQNWEAASKQYTLIDTEWSSIRDKWSIVIDHLEINLINIDLAELNSYIKSKEQTDSLSKIYSLKTLFTHIPDKESCTLKNIL